MPESEDLTRYSSPPDMSVFDPDKAGYDNKPYIYGMESRKNGIDKDFNPYLAASNHRLWDMGWDYEDAKQKLQK